MKYGWVNTNILDIWKRPIYNSERTNQLLWGDTVEISSMRNGFYKIKKYDGYEGWIDNQMIVLFDREKLIKYRKKVNSIVATLEVAIYNTSKKRYIEPFKLFYGTKIYVISKDKQFNKIKLPDGTICFIKKTYFERIPSNKKIRVPDFCDEFKKFIGTPYLWGGISSVGLDCSGMIQTVLSRFGIKYPRDTKDQIKVGRKITRNSIKTGDLLFFDRHVAVALNETDYIHSSIGGGGVRINSFDNSKTNYRLDLDRDFKFARRLSCFK